LRGMPVEFLTDDEEAAYGRYAGAPSQADLERVFFLDDEDRRLVDLRRGEHMKAGFALQLVTVRWLGMFLEDPLDVPGEVLAFVAGQLGMADPAVVKRYTGRVKTKSDHPQEIRRRYGLRDFAGAEAELAEQVAARRQRSARDSRARGPSPPRTLGRPPPRRGSAPARRSSRLHPRYPR
jgi:TnpA family transposase